MKFYSISVKLFSFRLKNTNKIGIGNKDMGPRKAIKIIKIQKITWKLKFQQYRYNNYIWKEKKNATILKLYNNLNLL